MAEIITLSNPVVKQSRRLRTKHADSDGKDASFSTIVRMALEESDMWKPMKKNK